MDFFREISDGDNVSVKIPKRDRHATDVRRLPCVIIQNGSGKQLTYKLLSEFGVLSKRYTASKLMSFPAEVKCGDASVKISLRVAAKKVLKSNNIFCHCKGTCKTMSCRCCKEQVFCSSRCHGVSSESCKNKNCYIKELSYKSKSKLHKQSKPHASDFPVFGGIISFQNTLYKFANTCPVDTWLTIFRFLSPVLKNQENTSKLQHLLQLIEQNNFNAGKLQVANDNDIKSKKETIDFFGNEFDLMIKTYLQIIYRYEVFSSCSSSYCSNKELLVECTSYPSLKIVSYDDPWITPTIISEKINEWFEGISTARCGQKVSLTVPKGFYFTDENSVTEELGHYRNGQRVTHQRIFEKMPVLLPVNIDCASLVKSVDFDSVPEVTTVRSANAAIHMYILKAVSLWDRSHYTCCFKSGDDWLFYDGKQDPVVSCKSAPTNL